MGGAGSRRVTKMRLGHPLSAYWHAPQTGTTNDRRSMSVSSVDTSATSTTRAGTKRQKLS